MTACPPYHRISSDVRRAQKVAQAVTFLCSKWILKLTQILLLFFFFPSSILRHIFQNPKVILVCFMDSDNSKKVKTTQLKYALK